MKMSSNESHEPCVMALVRDIVSTVNKGQFAELAGLFSDRTKPLYFRMTVPQLLEHHEAVLQEHPGLLMRLFLSQLSSGSEADSH